MSTRLDRLKTLQKALNDYVKQERNRIDNEVSVLTAILSGRTGGKGIQQVNTNTVTTVAQNDLSSYLQGD